MAILALMVSQIAVPKGKKKLRWRNDHQVDHRVTDLRQNCRNQGQGGEGISSPYLNKGGGDYTHHITTPPPDYQTFLRPCNGQCNGEWKDEMQRYLSFRCWVLHYNGVKFFLVEHSYLYVSWIWNTFIFINCMQSPQSATTSKRLKLFL